jgi:hypothetical protein
VILPGIGKGSNKIKREITEIKTGRKEGTEQNRIE